MIKFNSSGGDVKIVVDSGVGKFTFTHHCAEDYLAGLMRDQYEKHMNSVLEQERRKAYDQGWKDAKAKRKRETWFSGWWS